MDFDHDLTSSGKSKYQKMKSENGNKNWMFLIIFQARIRV
jgi:hypothetical protein